MNDAVRAAASRRRRSRTRAGVAAWDSDVAWSFRHSPVAIGVVASCSLICVLAALFAPLLAPHNPFDLKTLNLSRRAVAAALD